MRIVTKPQTATASEGTKSNHAYDMAIYAIVEREACELEIWWRKGSRIKAGRDCGSVIAGAPLCAIQNVASPLRLSIFNSNRLDMSVAIGIGVLRNLAPKEPVNDAEVHDGQHRSNRPGPTLRVWNSEIALPMLIEVIAGLVEGGPRPEETDRD